MGKTASRGSDKNYLLDGKYSIKELLNPERLGKVYENFAALTGLSVGLIALPNLEILVPAGWQEICHKFHRAFPESAQVCVKSNQKFTEDWTSSQEIRFVKCGLGLTDVLTPLIVDGKVLAVVLVGQIFLDKPDPTLFAKQAKKYGYDLDEYLLALKQVPIVERERVEAALIFLRNMTAMMVEGNLRQLRVQSYSEQLKREVSERKKAEEMLRQSEASYRGLFESVSEAIYIQARDGSFLDVNRGAVEMYGYPREYFIGKTPADIGAPGKNDLKQVQVQFQKALQGEPQQFEFWGLRSDGQPFLKEVRLYKGLYFGEEVVIALARDIMERKRSEDEMRRRLKELSVLHAVSEVGTKAATLDDLIREATQVIAKTFDLDSFGVMLYDPSRKALVIHSSYVGDFQGRDLVVIPLGRGITGCVAAERKPCLVRDVEKDSRYLAIQDGIRSELCVPIMLGDELIGVVNAESRQVDYFSEDDLRLFTTISGTLATSIERLHLLDEEQRRRREAETLRDVTTALTTTLQMDALLKIILDSAAKIVPYDSASIILMDGQEFKIVAARGLPDSIGWQGKKFKINKKWKVLISKKEPLILRDAQTEACFENWPGSEYIHGWMGVPLLARGEVIGCLCLDSCQLDAFTEAQASLMQTFANQVAVVIENARLFESEHRRWQEAETLRLAASAIASTLDRDEAVRLILEQLARVVPYDSASVQELRDGYLEIVGGRGWADPAMVLGMRFPVPGNNPNTVVVQTRRPFVLNNAPATYREFRVAPHSHIRSWLGVPLVVQERMIGILAIDSCQPNYFTEDKITLVAAFANQAAAAMANSRLYQDALQAAERRAILHRVSQEIVLVGQDAEKVYEAIHRAAKQLMPAESFVISVVDETKPDEIILVYLYDKGRRYPSFRVPRDGSLSGTIISSGESRIFSDLSKDEIDKVVHFGDEEKVRSILVVPMRLGDKIIGMLSAQSYRPNAYTGEDRLLLEMLSAYAATAIENIRLYRETGQRLTELETLNRISTILREAQTIHQMLPRLLDETLKAIHSQAGAIWLYNVGKRVLIQTVSQGWFTKIQEKEVLPGEGMVGSSFAEGKIIISRDLSRDPLIYASWQELASGWSGVCIPIRTLQEVTGVLFLAVELPRQILPEETHLLSIVSEIAGNAIRRSQLHEQTQNQLQRLASLRVIDIAINTILDLRVILNILIEHILSQLGVDAAAVLLLNPKTQLLQHAASAGFRSEAVTSWRVYLANDIASRAIRSRSMVFIERLREITQRGRLVSIAGDHFVSYICVPLIAKGQVKGVLELYHRTPLEVAADWKNFLETMASQTAIAIDNAQLFEELQKMNVDLVMAYDAVIEGWAKALDLRGCEAEGHTQRLTDLTVRLASALGLPENELVHVRRGALLHDIGTMSIPDGILSKPGPLTESEWEMIRRHPLVAYNMLNMILYLRPALDIPYCHHERWDGSGYPRGLAGEEIPIAARIFAVVDVWDSLTSDRPYRKAWSRVAALEYIKSNSGILFDPRVVEAFLSLVGREGEN